MLLGTHVSIKGGVHNAPVHAEGQTTFQFYTRNARSWKAKELSEESIQLFQERRRSMGYRKVVVHMPYLPNLSNTDRVKAKLTRDTLLSEIERCEALGVDFLVMHIGSHMGRGVEVGIQQVIEHLNTASPSAHSTTLLLENTSGSRNAVGSSFVEIAQILDGLDEPSKFGVCLDTCHTHVAGYDLSEGKATETLDIIDNELGFERVRVIHVNDAMGEVGSRRDRHWHIGLGTIGTTGFKEFFSSELVKGKADLPLILETPITDERGDEGNLLVLRDIVVSAGGTAELKL